MDRNGTPFFTLFEAKHKTFVPLSQIPRPLQQALIASEDKDFYAHNGFSVKSILRSIRSNIEERRLAYGGSTITQQLVKNALLTPQKNFLRKYQEAVLAYEIERRYSKEEILEMYLNSVYFGEGAFGAEEGAQVYFGKSSRELNLAESSFLIALLPAPSRLSPLNGDTEPAKLRQNLVLDRMANQGYITEEEKDRAVNEELEFSGRLDDFNSKGLHFALMVGDELKTKYSEETISRSGFRVRTTIDLTWQTYAEETVSSQVKKLAVNNVSNGAAVVLDPRTGEIKALVGSKDWHDGKFGRVNVPVMPRQPGSSFKPIIYSAALEKGLITPATILKDSPITYSNKETGFIAYRPQNYDRKFRGDVTARRALSNSLNVPAVEVMSKVGVIEGLNMAHRLGITTLEDPGRFGLSLVLGAGEVKLVDLTTVYGVFANQGVKNDPVSILEITDKQNQIVYSYQPDPQPVLSPGVAFLISSMLSDSGARREVFGNALDNSRGAAVKTGTTENYKDAWTMGYTPSLVVGVWVGNNDGAVMDNIAGSLGAAPIFKSLIEKFSEGTPIQKFTPPDEVLQLNCKASAKDNGYQEFFLKSTAHPGFCSRLSTATPTPTPTKALIPTSTIIPTLTPTPTPARTPTPTKAPTPAPSPTSTKTPTPTPTPRP